MNLHEYQAKQLFADYGLPVPSGIPCVSADEAVAATKKLGGDKWVVKCQVHAGGRGKAGGVKVATCEQDVRAFAEHWLANVWSLIKRTLMVSRLTPFWLKPAVTLLKNFIWARLSIVVPAV